MTAGGWSADGSEAEAESSGSRRSRVGRCEEAGDLAPRWIAATAARTPAAGPCAPRRVVGPREAADLRTMARLAAAARHVGRPDPPVMPAMSSGRSRIAADLAWCLCRPSRRPLRAGGAAAVVAFGQQVGLAGNDPDDVDGVLAKRLDEVGLVDRREIERAPRPLLHRRQAPRPRPDRVDVAAAPRRWSMARRLGRGCWAGRRGRGRDHANYARGVKAWRRLAWPPSPLPTSRTRLSLNMYRQPSHRFRRACPTTAPWP